LVLRLRGRSRRARTGKLPTIGFLGQSTRSAASEWVAAHVQRLRELGWIEGRNITIEPGPNLQDIELAKISQRVLRTRILVGGTPRPAGR
jgi:hypothetical protein